MTNIASFSVRYLKAYKSDYFNVLAFQRLIIKINSSLLCFGFPRMNFTYPIVDQRKSTASQVTSHERELEFLTPSEMGTILRCTSNREGKRSLVSASLATSENG